MTDDDGASRRPAFATRREVLSAGVSGVAVLLSGSMSDPVDPGTYGTERYGFGTYGDGDTDGYGAGGGYGDVRGDQ